MRRVTLLTAPVLAFLLAACGSSGPQPGTALELDGQRVTTRHLDDIASRYCSALAQVGTKVTTQAVRKQVVSALALRLMGERFSAAEGVEPDSSYDAQVAQLEPQLTAFDQKTQDAIIEVEGAESFATALVNSGGQQRFTDWLGDQHVVVNPVYGVTIDGDSFKHVDPSLSVAASSEAKTAVDNASNPSAAPATGSRACA
ncbi:peptidyl-prolyl cis-trans isomerase SurA [Nocardioides terrae]|uniref:Peptidyl-prolyl cis-trans isomerase SurA n=1 Tax=Nocardioides terrae TaxID=574651 RepID=A0A1I1P173_9ACTN|nr:hypothetical protein [Nocardioides terrae]SFD03557.1 peptidyl-prolyl cis-trans isomerase SurA [Nocardioides terrae]